MTRQGKWWLIAALAALLCGCSSPDTPAAGPSPGASAAVPGNELVGRGMVLQKQGGMPVLCLGAVAASLPPQCGGPVIRNWDWSEAGHFARAAGVMWGSYTVTGTFSNYEFTLTRRPVSSSEDELPTETEPTPGPPGNGKEMQLLLLQKELTSLRGQPILKSWVENGYLNIDVVYDDGSLQRELDAKYGPRIVLLRSALKPLDGDST